MIGQQLKAQIIARTILGRNGSTMIFFMSSNLTLKIIQINFAKVLSEYHIALPCFSLNKFDSSSQVVFVSF